MYIYIYIYIYQTILRNHTIYVYIHIEVLYDFLKWKKLRVEKGEIKIPRDRREFEFEKLINIGNSDSFLSIFDHQSFDRILIHFPICPLITTKVKRVYISDNTFIYIYIYIHMEEM